MLRRCNRRAVLASRALGHTAGGGHGHNVAGGTVRSTRLPAAAFVAAAMEQKIAGTLPARRAGGGNRDL
jgi:hypothetical protein